MPDGATTMDDSTLSAAERLALETRGRQERHEAECALQWKFANARLARIEYALIGIVLLLLFGEGTVIEVIKRLLVVAK